MRRQIVLVMIVLMTSATLAGAASLQNVQSKIAKKTAVERLQVREENGKVILEGLAVLSREPADRTAQQLLSLQRRQ